MSYVYLNCENCISSQEQGEASLAASFADIPASVLSRSSPIADKCCCNASETACCPCSRSGMMSQSSTGDRGGGESMSSAVASPVKTSLLPGKGPESTANAPDSGERWRGSLAKYDPVSRSWKTRQRSLLGGLVEFSGTWPKWGTTVGGESYRLKTPAGLEDHRRSIISAKESGLSQSLGTPTTCSTGRSEEFKKGRRPTPQEVATLTMPTPGAAKANNDVKLTCSGDGRQKPNKLGWAVAATERMPTAKASDHKGSSKPGQRRGQLTDPAMGIIEAGGSLNPTWVEWLMGWPLGWTDLKPLGTDKFRQWLTLHGRY